MLVLVLVETSISFSFCYSTSGPHFCFSRLTLPTFSLDLVLVYQICIPYTKSFVQYGLFSLSS